MRDKTYNGLVTFGSIFLFLAVFVIPYMIYSMDIKKFQKNFIPMSPKVSTKSQMIPSMCTFRQLSPEEVLEEKMLLDSIAWPETPPVPTPLSLHDTSDAAHSSFTILPKKGGGQWHVGEQLEVTVNIHDFQGRPRKYGGDLLLARLHNRTLGAGVAGQVIDHLNGSYTAVFSLLWEGNSHVEINLDHSSEAVHFMDKFVNKWPDGVNFFSTFHSGSVTENTMCSVCLPPSQKPLCNYTDLHTGDPWFCYKPKKLSCDARVTHYSQYKKAPKAEEDMLFQNGVTMNAFVPASGPGYVTVLPKEEGQLAVGSSKVKPGPAGYYYQGQWRSLSGPKVQQFDTAAAISQCLKGKVVHMYGDSTVRQWLEYLSAQLPDLQVFNPYKMKQSGPYTAVNSANKIFMTYRSHGLPIRIIPSPVTELHYIANEIDSITGGKSTGVIFGIWAHFTTFPIEVYVRRLMTIRKAVVRLLARAPETVIIIRTANLKHSPTPYTALLGADWHSLQRDKVLRAMFKGLNVHLVEAWEMTVAHHLPHDIHPPPPIIKNMINVILSYICPLKQ